MEQVKEQTMEHMKEQSNKSFQHSHISQCHISRNIFLDFHIHKYVYLTCNVRK